jgi:PAS domain S-box-containing protein
MSASHASKASFDVDHEMKSAQTGECPDKPRIELSLMESELRFRRLFEAAKDGILILDGESGAIIDANPFLLDLLGRSHAELVGKYLWEIGLLGDEAASRDSFRELQTKGYVRYEDLPLRSKRGSQVEVEVVSNVYHVGGQMIIQCNIRDITERKRSEEQLRRAKEAAEEAGLAKDRFIAMLSHELRTPLTPVLATVAYLETMGELPKELRGEIALIRRNIELEARLIDDLLDLTRIDHGKMELKREIVNVHIVIRAALEICQAEIDAKKLEVSLALRADSHLVWADPSRLQQIFWNLIKNAVKYTPTAGRITIASADACAGRLAIEVADTGDGIAPEDLHRIFDAFEQGDRSASRQHGGLGLGLAIARILVDMHGGTLTAANKDECCGSVFRVELEIISQLPDKDPPPVPDLQADKDLLKILLVEDNPDTLRAISLLLRSAGFAVQTAVNVREAITSLSLKRFNLLISDIGLPDGSGLEIMRYGRDKFGLHGIAFSGYATNDDVAESKAAGFAHHLAKPSRFDVLVDLVRVTAA